MLVISVRAYGGFCRCGASAPPPMNIASIAEIAENSRNITKQAKANFQNEVNGFWVRLSVLSPCNGSIIMRSMNSVNGKENIPVIPKAT